MRRGSILWGILIILLGVLLLLNTMGYFETIDVWGLFMAVGFIGLGLWVLLSVVRGARSAEVDVVSIPLQGAERARVRINHAAGTLRLDAGAEPGALVSGTFAAGLDFDAQQRGGTMDVEMRVPHTVFPAVIFPGIWVGGKGFAWDLGLNPGVSLELDLDTGANDARIDLTNLRVTDLRLQTGASSTSVTLPAEAGRTHAEINAGAASVTLRVPTGVAARVKASGGLSSIHVDRNRFPRSGSVYQSTDYDTAANRVDIEVEVGVGSVDVR